MAGTKRPRESEHDGPSKVRRTARAPLKTIGMMQAGPIEMKTANDYLQRYNHLLPFAKNDRDFRASHQEMLDAQSEIERIVREAQAAVSEQLDRMLNVVAIDLPDATRLGSRFFQRGDVMTLNLSDFQDMLDNVRAEDALAFLAHLRKLWVDCADLWARYDEVPPFKYYDFLVRTFLSVEKLLLFEDDAAVERACFLFTIFVQTRIGTQRLADPRRCGIPLDAEGKANMADCDRQMAKTDVFLSIACPRISYRSGHDYAPENGDDRAWYWSTAAAWRELWQGFSLECEPDEGVLTYCQHKRILAMLKPMLRQAHDETRKLCQIAAGGRLPVELVDVVHEYMLIAEEIPLDRTIAAPAKTENGKDIHWDSDSSCDEDDSNIQEESVDRKPVLHEPYRLRCLRNHDEYGDWDVEDAA